MVQLVQQRTRADAYLGQCLKQLGLERLATCKARVDLLCAYTGIDKAQYRMGSGGRMGGQWRYLLVGS